MIDKRARKLLTRYFIFLVALFFIPAILLKGFFKTETFVNEVVKKNNGIIVQEQRRYNVKFCSNEDKNICIAEILKKKDEIAFLQKNQTGIKHYLNLSQLYNWEATKELEQAIRGLTKI